MDMACIVLDRVQHTGTIVLEKSGDGKGMRE